jgi:hypothetical protein
MKGPSKKGTTGQVEHKGAVWIMSIGFGVFRCTKIGRGCPLRVNVSYVITGPCVRTAHHNLGTFLEELALAEGRTLNNSGRGGSSGTRVAALVCLQHGIVTLRFRASLLSGRLAESTIVIVEEESRLQNEADQHPFIS